MKIRITTTIEYEIKEADESLTPEQILAIDLINIEANPRLLLHFPLKITGEII